MKRPQMAVVLANKDKRETGSASSEDTASDWSDLDVEELEVAVCVDLRC